MVDLPKGRAEKPIDWERVDQLLKAGCTGTEIAAYFNIYPDTLYRRIENRYGMLFTAYAAETRQIGDSQIREAQFEKAISKDNTMLVWLGKNRLGQRDHEEKKDAPQDSNLALLLAEIKQRPQIDQLMKEIEDLKAKLSANESK